MKVVLLKFMIYGCHLSYFIMYYRMEAQRSFFEMNKNSARKIPVVIDTDNFTDMAGNFSCTIFYYIGRKNVKEHFLTIQMLENILDLHHITTKKGYEVE